MGRILCKVDMTALPSGTVAAPAVSLVAPLQQTVQITTSQVTDPVVLTKQLNSIQRELSEATRQTRSGHQFEIIFQNQTCGVSGAKLSLTHRFGEYAFFQVIGWRGASTTTAPILVDDRNDAAATVFTDNNTLSLRSYVAGVADIRVFA